MQTYKIIGTDQKEYGPVSADQIKQWIAQRRVVAQTMAQADGGEWKKLGAFPEFAAAFAYPIPSAAPVAPRPEYTAPPATSGLAITSLILGILGIISCGLSSLVGLILGIVAMKQIRKSNGTLGGHGIALAGTIVSAVFLLFAIPVGAAMLLPALAKAKQRAESIQCINNLRQLSVGAHVYANAHTNHLPPAETWGESLQPWVNPPSSFKCPTVKDTPDRCSYGFNSQLDGMDIDKVNPNTVLFFEIEGGWDVSGGPELLLKRSRHARTIAVAFADGHVEQVSESRLASLRWNP